MILVSVSDHKTLNFILVFKYIGKIGNYNVNSGGFLIGK